MNEFIKPSEARTTKVDLGEGRILAVGVTDRWVALEIWEAGTDGHSCELHRVADIDGRSHLHWSR